MIQPQQIQMIEQYVQATYDMVILEANKRLAKMTESRYKLMRKDKKKFRIK